MFGASALAAKSTPKNPSHMYSAREPYIYLTNSMQTDKFFPVNTASVASGQRWI